MATATKTRAERHQEKREQESNTFELTLDERIGLLMVLPRTGDLLSLRILQDLQYALSPTEEEAKQGKLRNVGGGFAWGMEAKDVKKVVVIGERAKELIVQGIEAAGKKQALELQWLSLYDRFLPPLPEEDVEESEEPSANGLHEV